MYASKKTIGKLQLWSGAPADKNTDRKIKHGNRPNGNGRLFYVQTVVLKQVAEDANDTLTKTVVHECKGNTYKTVRKKKRLRKSMANQPK